MENNFGKKINIVKADYPINSVIQARDVSINCKGYQED